MVDVAEVVPCPVCYMRGWWNEPEMGQDVTRACRYQAWRATTNGSP